jgi:hypothetical protein
MSTRTPLSGAIKMSDLDKSITLSWSGNNPNQSLRDYEKEDFFQGDPGAQPCGFAYCYGTPGTTGPHKLGDYYDILGWVNYRCTAVGLTMFNPGGIVQTHINPMNGSNGTPPNPIPLISGIEMPNGANGSTGAHWETLQFVTEVAGMFGGAFDVYFDGNYIDTITGDGVYVYDNGGVGYTNGYGTNGTVEIMYRR